jgi:predicted short-subunit dehydrogenase-like oxidoreductase (DUF2520 family)
MMSSTLSIIGAGRAGRALGRRLHELGWRIGVVATQSITTARAATRAIGAGQPSDCITHQVLASDVALITVPDAAIPEVAAEMAQMGGKEWRGKVVLHTSGALDSSALAPLAEAGAAVGSIHPMQTFGLHSAPALEEHVFGIEGDAPAVKVARKMCRQIGGTAVRLSGANKAAYHAGASFACAHVLTMLEAATRLLMSQGFTRRAASRALLPLTRQTLDNFERLGPHAAWTGPLARGDFSTVARHAEALRQFPPEYLDAYEAASRLAAETLSGSSKKALLQKLKFGGAPKASTARA